MVMFSAGGFPNSRVIEVWLKVEVARRLLRNLPAGLESESSDIILHRTLLSKIPSQIRT